MPTDPPPPAPDPDEAQNALLAAVEKLRDARRQQPLDVGAIAAAAVEFSEARDVYIQACHAADVAAFLRKGKPKKEDDDGEDEP